MRELSNFSWHPMWTSEMGCLRACLDHLGVAVTDAWLFGVSGHAFALNIHRELCLSGPTAWRKERLLQLSENLGCQLRSQSSHQSMESFAQDQGAAWDMIRAAIDGGLPCYGWELDIPEYFIIQGYTDEGYVFSGPTKQGGIKPWNELGVSGIGVLEVHVIGPPRPADERVAVCEALRFAVEHSRTPEKWVIDDLYQAGLSGYDAWIGALEAKDVSEPGMAYNTQVWGECRQHAPLFLIEARERIDSQWSSLFDEAVGHFETVAQQFQTLRQTFPFQPDRWEEMIEDRERLDIAVQCLSAAREAEARGLDVLDRIASDL